MITVVTANFGGHDLPPHVPAPQTVECEWLYYTDREMAVPAPWQAMRVEPRFPDSSNLSAKVYKMTPNERGDVVWIDANMEITARTFVEEVLTARRDGIALFAHPRRDCVYAEADASLGAESQGGKYEEFRRAIGAQMRSYLALGYPRHGGLYACGTLAWDWTDVRAHELARDWLAECVRWSPQDQLSFPVAAWRNGIRPGVFPLGQLDRRYSTRTTIGNRWLCIHPHAPVSRETPVPS